MDTNVSSPLTLSCGAILKNRLCKAAMTEGLADERNRATDRHVTLYRRWAEGGAGLLLTGNVQVDRRYLERAGNIVVDGPQDGAQLAALEAMTGAGTGNDTHLWMQISHAGRQTPKLVAAEPVGPSDIPVALPGGRFGKPRALTDDEICDVIARFGYVASIAEQTGFTGVQIHSAHGYLLSEFLSPRVNVRDDEWGGSLQNRARLLLETVRAVRAAVGRDFPVAVKLNSADFQKGGFSFDDCLQVIEMLNEEGLDLLEISGGNYEQPRLMGITGLEPAVEEKVQESTRAREAYFFDYAVAARRVAKMPLMVTGGFRSARGMNEALSGGDVDMIGLARPLCVDPNFPARILSGELQQAPDVEKGLRIGPGILGPNSAIAAIKAMNGFARVGWYYEQLYRLADGLEPDMSMSALRALMSYDKSEKVKARQLVRQLGPG
ncbi:MAG: NADH:flavin oxidoreductase/NADH oxidase family protein [Gammaproteobacteria bacterium]|nr:NADH:flavin oxidoreductase/NADH oxidase family protein [Gammaproteobacteria bacterium]MDH3410445.1 NADH:flavin oxidoreductase/NADH oxidase family protein [Gammaproteobacteria bacterium]MDH3551002.1 NADH:flavin oxidoreductase/NADH oxidase family protein [Gammaproteobacteria bacterium]